MTEIIDLKAERDRRDGPDSDLIRYDSYGRKIFNFICDYQMDGKTHTFSIWAYDWEEAEKRAAAISRGVVMVGQRYSKGYS